MAGLLHLSSRNIIHTYVPYKDAFFSTSGSKQSGLILTTARTQNCRILKSVSFLRRKNREECGTEFHSHEITASRQPRESHYRNLIGAVHKRDKAGFFICRNPLICHAEFQ